MASAASDTKDPLAPQAPTPAANPTTSAPEIAPLIRLDPPIGPSSVPFHPTLAPQQEEPTCPQLNVFVKEALDQAKAFAAAEIPTFPVKATKKSHGSSAKVEVLSKTLDVGNDAAKKKESWVARRSVHAGQTEAGDASWLEFDSGLRRDHSLKEKEYTPNVKEAVEVCKWTAIEDVDGWKNIDMAVYEMVHRLPAPLKPRVFTILIVGGILDPTPDEIEKNSNAVHRFILLTVPMVLSSSTEWEKISTSKYADSAAAVHGSYVSVEHVHMSPEGQIHWAMATASDAKGNLPVAVQKLGVPGAITKDVGLFLGWVERRRQAA